MRLAEHLTGLRAWYKQCLLGETRRAPPRHRRDARAHVHTNMAMHKLSTPPPSSPPKGLRSYGYGHAQTEYTLPPPPQQVPHLLDVVMKDYESRGRQFLPPAGREKEFDMFRAWGET